MNGTDSTSTLVEQAERHLLLSSFFAAERAATEALQRSLYLKHSAEIQERAVIVLLQALYESQRFGECRKLLCDTFGRLEAVPGNSLLLWLSLALDSRSKQEAQSLILKLLQTKDPNGSDGWSHRQYMALLHLYLFDVLLPEIREVSGVIKWLESTQLPVDADNKQALKEELLALVPHPASVNIPSIANHRFQTAHATRAAPSSTAGGLLAGQHMQNGQAQQQPHHQQPAAEMQSEIEEVQAGGGSSSSGQAEQSGGGGGVGLDEMDGALTAQVAPTAGDSDGWGGGPDGWLSASWQVWSSLREACRAAVAPWVEGRREGGGEGGGGQPPRPSGSAVAGTVLGAVLLYALYAERRAISRRMSTARQRAVKAVGDLLSMDLSVSPNPVMAPR